MRWTVVAMLVVACEGGTVPVDGEDPDAELCAFVQDEAVPLPAQVEGHGPWWGLATEDRDGSPTSWAPCEAHTVDGVGYVDIHPEWAIKCEGNGIMGSDDGVRTETWRCQVQQFDQGWALTEDCDWTEVVGMTCDGKVFPPSP